MISIVNHKKKYIWIKRIPILFFLTGLLFGISNMAVAQAEEGVFGNLRAGLIQAEDDVGDKTDGSAFGGKLGYVSPTWQGLTTGATFYATSELFDDENGDFFSSENGSYAILGEAFVQAEYGNSLVRLGRFELDTPHADTDDIRMIPNTFQGVFVSNTDITSTTLYLTHLDKWAGVDSEIPERFQEMNGDKGITAVGAVYEGITNLAVQGWYYHGRDFAKLFYTEAVYEINGFGVGFQYASQADDTSDESAPDGDVWGISGGYSLTGFTVSAAYNDVSGTVTNGFGGGPFFTSADDHTIDGVEDQEAVAFGLEYAGIDALTVGFLYVDFDEGANETDYYALYDVNEALALELIYTDMHEDGEFVRFMANYGF